MRAPGYGTTLLMMTALSFAACGDGESENGGNGGNGGVAQCTSAQNCPRSCANDSDCNTDDGQVCCNYGSNFGNACVNADFCAHRFCQSDSDCATDDGEACCRFTSASNQRVCTRSNACLVECDSNADCTEGEQLVCSTIFSEPICAPQDRFPSECSTSSDCDGGEVCCTQNLDRIRDFFGDNVLRNVSGLCAGSCPRSCSTSQDCDGQVCCDGLCADSCPRSCSRDTDCRTDQGELCCTNNAALSPWFGSSPPRGNSGCTNTCRFAFDGECDDGGPGAVTSICDLGTDCGDCGPR